MNKVSGEKKFIIVLGIIAAILVFIFVGYPIANSVYNKQMQKAYDEQVEDIVAATRTFAGANRNFLTEQGTIVTVAQLMKNGYLKPTIDAKNQSTGEIKYIYEDPKNNDMTSYRISVSKVNKSYVIDLIDCGTWESKIKLTNYCN